jgi:hypothetical protein
VRQGEQTVLQEFKNCHDFNLKKSRQESMVRYDWTHVRRIQVIDVIASAQRRRLRARTCMLATSAKAETEEITNAVQAPDIVPALLMLSPNVVVFSIATAVVLLATILLWLSILMPPEMTPVSTMPPLRKVLLLTEMPPGPMVLALVTPPLKVVWLTTKASVLPLNVVG